MKTYRFISILLLISLFYPIAWGENRKDNKPKEKKAEAADKPKKIVFR